jgi:NAD(P)-dependent dehydrogenase (short-subunit alcohol dehydrogenase family)
VVVTGAARRLGGAIALDLARHGYDIALHCRQSDADAQAAAGQIRALGRRVEIVEADLSEPAAVERVMPAAVAALGRIDGLVNSASTFEHDGIDDFSLEHLQSQMASNVAAPILLARALHRAAAGRALDLPPACVVNLLDNKLWNPNPDYLSYSCSKFALEGATRMLALALAPRVRVMGIAPGITLPSGPMTHEQFEAAHARTPLGRSSTPEDITQTVRFILANRALTGTTIIVDGGQHLWPSPRDVQFTESGS